MGEFDFGQFQQLFDYLQGKLNQGGALTPEEQKAYDGLMAIANQGLDLTNTADFKSLYTAFNTLADSETKKKFEELYGTGLLEDPATHTIQFTRPGTLVAAMMRKGLSIKDGPIQALLSEGMRNFLDTTAKNSFAAMTNSYQAMTPIRAQNIQAATNAGQIASTAIGRLAGVAGAAVSGARGGAGGGEAGAGGQDLPLPPGPPVPSLWDKILPGLLTALATGGLGALAAYLRGGDKTSNDPTHKYYTGEELDAAAAKIVGRSRGDAVIPYSSDLTPQAAGGTTSSDYIDAAQQRLNLNPYQVDQAAFQGTPANMGALRGTDPYSIDQSLYQTAAQPSYAQAGSPWAGLGLTPANYTQPGGDWTNPLDPGQYYGMSDQAWSNPGQSPYDYSAYSAMDWSQPWDSGGGGGGGGFDWGGGSTQDTYDWGANFDPNAGGGGGGDWSGPSSTDWYSSAY